MRQSFPSLPSLDRFGQKTPESQIPCPSCGEEISLSEALRKQYTEKFEKEFRQKEQVAAGMIKQKEELLVQKAKFLEQDYADKLATQRTQLEKSLKEQLAKAKEVELEDLKNRLDESEK